MLTYGYCFGVELTIDNVIAAYFADTFGKGIVAAGNLAAIFGLFNIISRPLGPPSRETSRTYVTPAESISLNSPLATSLRVVPKRE